MSFEKITCYVANCTGCGSDCWDGVEDGPPHFVCSNTVATAQTLADKHGWVIEKQTDGTVWMWCPRCARRRQCEHDGHQWYTPAVSEAYADGVRPVELCSHCGKVRRGDEPLASPPAGHPDTVSIPLSGEHKTLLDTYEAEFADLEARKET